MGDCQPSQLKFMLEIITIEGYEGTLSLSLSLSIGDTHSWVLPTTRINSMLRLHELATRRIIDKCHQRQLQTNCFTAVQILIKLDKEINKCSGRTSFVPPKNKEVGGSFCGCITCLLRNGLIDI